MNVNINELLNYAISANASDLHLSVGSIPMVRIDGKMQALQLPALKNEEMIQVRNEVLNDNQKKILDEKLEIDFSYQIKDKGEDLGLIFLIKLMDYLLPLELYLL